MKPGYKPDVNSCRLCSNDSIEDEDFCIDHIESLKSISWCKVCGQRGCNHPHKKKKK